MPALAKHPLSSNARDHPEDKRSCSNSQWEEAGETGEVGSLAQGHITS